MSEENLTSLEETPDDMRKSDDCNGTDGWSDSVRGIDEESDEEYNELSEEFQDGACDGDLYEEDHDESREQEETSGRFGRIKNPVLREIVSWAVDIVVIVLISLFIVTFVGQRTVVDGSSMYDTLENGDNLIVDKLSYRFGEIERFDIVVFRYHNDPDVHYIKRVIGLPGETVQIIGDDIYINGEILEEHYRYEENMEWAGIAAEPITLGEDEYFCLGDNRNNSSDSRDPDVGVIPKDWIVGKAFIRIYPFSEFGLLTDEDE